MRSRRRVICCRFGVEGLEARFVPSGAAEVAGSHHTGKSHASTFVAELTPDNVVLPLDMNGNQIQGGGGAALYPLPVSPTQQGMSALAPPPSDPARGVVGLTITDGGKAIDVFGSLSRISNVAAVTLHDLQYPAAFALRGSPTSPTGQIPQVNYGSSPPPTVNTTTAVSPGTYGQIQSENIGQTIAVLLKPGPGSGTVAHRTFEMTLTPSDLVGPLAGATIPPLARALRRDPSAFYVNVQTSDGIDPATGAQQDGNFPFGELRGAFTAKTSGAGKAHR